VWRRGGLATFGGSKGSRYFRNFAVLEYSSTSFAMTARIVFEILTVFGRKK